MGPGGYDKDGKRIKPSVTVGDKVLIPQVSTFLFCLGRLGCKTKLRIGYSVVGEQMREVADVLTCRSMVVRRLRSVMRNIRYSETMSMLASYRPSISGLLTFLSQYPRQDQRIDAKTSREQPKMYHICISSA